MSTPPSSPAAPPAEVAPEQQQQQQQETTEAPVPVAETNADEQAPVVETSATAEESTAAPVSSEPPVPAPPAVPTQRLFVGNLGSSIRQPELSGLFERFMPDITELWVAREPPGFAFVTLPADMAEEFVSSFNGADLCGRSLVIEISKTNGAKRGERRPRDNNHNHREGGFRRDDRAPRDGGFRRDDRRGDDRYPPRDYRRDDRYPPRDDRAPRGDYPPRNFPPRDDRAPRGDYRPRDDRPRDDRPPRDDRAPREGGFRRDDRAPRDGGFRRDDRRGDDRYPPRDNRREDRYPPRDDRAPRDDDRDKRPRVEHAPVTRSPPQERAHSFDAARD